MGKFLGIQYVESQRDAASMSYLNPSDLFLNGVIDTRRGTCGNMAALHVAISRRMGWPVSLACAKGHWLSRFDDGEVTYNAEASSILPDGSFSIRPEEWYINWRDLPPRAMESGSDLRRLSAREMLGGLFGTRARHYRDIGKRDLAEADYCIAHALFPRHRHDYQSLMVLLLRRGTDLFSPNEIGHPNTVEMARNEAFCLNGPMEIASGPLAVKQGKMDHTVMVKNPLELSLPARNTLRKSDPTRPPPRKIHFEYLPPRQPRRPAVVTLTMPKLLI